MTPSFNSVIRRTIQRSKSFGFLWASSGVFEAMNDVNGGTIFFEGLSSRGDGVGEDTLMHGLGGTFTRMEKEVFDDGLRDVEAGEGGSDKGEKVGEGRGPEPALLTKDGTEEVGGGGKADEEVGNKGATESRVGFFKGLEEGHRNNSNRSKFEVWGEAGSHLEGHQ